MNKTKLIQSGKMMAGFFMVFISAKLGDNPMFSFESLVQFVLIMIGCALVKFSKDV